MDRAKSFAEAEANSNMQADKLYEVASKKHTAARTHPADKFAQNAASPTWVGGFDQLLGTKRNSA